MIKYFKKQHKELFQDLTNIISIFNLIQQENILLQNIKVQVQKYGILQVHKDSINQVNFK
jgi:hypothetical protein